MPMRCQWKEKLETLNTPHAEIKTSIDNTWGAHLVSHARTRHEVCEVNISCCASEAFTQRGKARSHQTTTFTIRMLTNNEELSSPHQAMHYTKPCLSQLNAAESDGFGTFKISRLAEQSRKHPHRTNSRQTTRSMCTHSHIHEKQCRLAHVPSQSGDRRKNCPSLCRVFFNDPPRIDTSSAESCERKKLRNILARGDNQLAWGYASSPSHWYEREPSPETCNVLLRETCAP